MRRSISLDAVYTQNPLCFRKCLDHGPALFPALNRSFALLEDFLKHVDLVKLSQKFTLEFFLGASNKIQHDSLGHKIRNCSFHDVEIRLEKQLCKKGTTIISRGNPAAGKQRVQPTDNFRLDLLALRKVARRFQYRRRLKGMKYMDQRQYQKRRCVRPLKTLTPSKGPPFFFCLLKKLPKNPLDGSASLPPNVGI